MNVLRAALAGALAALAAAAPAGAHPAGTATGPVRPDAASGLQAAAAATDAAGPCTESASRAMPEGGAHDHQDVTQHRGLACRVRQVAFDSLTDELAARPDVVLGEMDVKAGIAAVATIYPEGGILFFDVSDPADPRFQSWYRGMSCEGIVIANNCGAYVDLTADGKAAILSVQDLTVAPYPHLDPALRPAGEPGVEVIDVSDPRAPRLAQTLPVVSAGGVHTARTHVVPSGAAKGEYVYAMAGAVGVDISKFVETPAGRKLVPVGRVDAPDIHDMFVQNDPDGRTYLYIADGYGFGFQVWDVTDPASPTSVAVWDLTPECTSDWYAHTIDVSQANGKRIVTLPAELFTSGASSAAQRQLGCGNVRGNGDKVGPLWFIDATDWSKLPQLDDAPATVKKKSEQTLVTTWTNPAGRAAGNLTFSPHNQQVVGDRVYLSHYHGGVFVLDASAAFEGRSERPRELGHIVPSAEPSDTRPLLAPGSPLAIPRTRGRPSIWDMVFYEGHILAADQIGGFYSLVFEGDEARAARARG